MHMPYVNIRVTREGVSADQKRQLIEGATDLLLKVLGKPPESTFVVIDEVDPDNWGVAGESVSALRRRQAPRTS
ncbi:4-oxalocrotonate tautomerase family protein [Pseudomonas aeruginosa]|nr:MULTISPECIES: 4-oxalocrotonate tautomerase family protein [Pseudomonas aeruginosa group]MCV3851471.1 4-oxalocrotonate tautomerase family protein [Pseudomonas aeruginosa]MCV3857502.1 4-oxalocrotonate tautomerase family protein [Pseudomonas aeruginosa]MDU0746279.1 4-oxalocrotonate tautomerase family protein [Pseudomonas aeruginosa]MDU0758358.1 4-oxalocrotonate tautomerase family protein [Pseudomonas aeruginosa]